MPSYSQYKRQIAVLDADDTEIESWITVRGNHIPIKKGQSKEEAVKSFIEHQAGKNDLPQGTKWSPTNTKGEGTGNKPSQKKEKYNIQHGAKISDIESMINAHADKKAYKSWKEEEEYVAEKLKEEGIYAYGGQIKEAMKNVYGDAYTKERKEESKKQESSKKWSGAWSKRANKPVTLGEAAKNATSIAKMTKMSASKRNEEVGYPMLEIANNDVEFTQDPAKNRSALSKAIKENGHENAELMQSVLSGLSAEELKDADSVRKGIRDYMKSYNKKKATDSWKRLWGKK